MIPMRKIRVHVRNKNRYNPETQDSNFLYVDINDFAGTTVGDIKEDVRRQSRGAIRIDELFLDNESLADDRSVAHYNLEDGCILETTSNPFWVACLYIKASEVRQEMEGNPNDKHIQEWTQKSLPKKYTLIGLLLNAKNEYGRQPPYFSTLDEFAIYLERLNKKAATMHPEYTQKDMRAFEREYRQEFLGRYDDPIAAFIDHHAVRLEQRPLNGPNVMPRNVQNTRNIPVPGRPKPVGRKKQKRYCDDCEEALADVYCTECQGGLAMCRRCSAVLHAGASRRRHDLQDIEQAPSNSSKPYVPRAFLAPFSIVLAMYNALTTQSILSLTEDEIKRRAQPLTDTDLQDKQAGKYVGGFDCMENVLMNKGFVKKEAARVPTYALSASGQMLGQRLYTFYTQFHRFMQSCRIPKVHNTAKNGIINNRKLCLIVDDNERDKQRLLRYAAEKNIDVQVRLLPAGDYIWILTPPMMDPQTRYTGKDYGNERVLPFVVERKSWEDFENSTNSGRFKRQINNMLGCGLANCFYLMEGSTSGLRNNPTQHHQQYLKGLLEKLVTENGFYVNYTSSWMKSAQWLLWFTGFLIDGWRKGVLQDGCISYQEYMSRVARQRGNTVINSAFRNARRHAHTWKAQQFVDHIIRDSHGEREMMSTVKEDLGITNRTSKHLLVLQNLEQYNKKRQSALNKCCEAVYTDPGQARDIVEDRLGPVVHNMLHYDIASYWQLYMQVMVGVYVVRTETDQDTENIHRIFTSTISAATPHVTLSAAVPKATNRRTANPRKSQKTATITSPRALNHIADDLLDLGHNLLSPRRNLSEPEMRIYDGNVYDDGDGSSKRRKANIHSIFTQNSTPPPFHLLREENEEERLSTSGHVIKNGRKIFESDNDIQRRQTTVVSNTIQPFLGQGYCLGTRSAENDLVSERRVKTCRADDTLHNETMKYSLDQGRCQSGLVDGMWNSRNNSQEVRGNRKGNSDDNEAELFDREVNDIGQAVHNTDFVNSQNEDEIMKEILAKSAAEVTEMINEDKMIKLAVEMSKQKSAKKTKDITRNNFTDDEELLQALEISKASEKGDTFNNPLSEDGEVSNFKGQVEINYLDKTKVMTLSEEEELKHVLEMSKTETVRFQNKEDKISSRRITIGGKENEDEMFKLAVEMCMTEPNNAGKGLENEMHLCTNEDELIFVPDTEEEQMKLALEISKRETPKKLQHNCHRSVNEHTSEQRKPFKRKRLDSELHSGGKVAESDYEKLSEEEQLKIAMELSMSQMAKENENSKIKEKIRSGINENADKYSNVGNKLTTGNFLSVGVSPCKKSKPDQNCNKLNIKCTEKCEVECFLDKATEVNHIVEKNDGVIFHDESEDFRRAIARSKVENGPAKKVKLGEQLFDEDELMKIVIERSKIEHSPWKKSVIEKPKKEEVSPSASSIEVIEINSQNSQDEDDDIIRFERDIITIVDTGSCIQNDTVINSGGIKSTHKSQCVLPQSVFGVVQEGGHFVNVENKSNTEKMTCQRDSNIDTRCSVSNRKTESNVKTISAETDINSLNSQDACEYETVGKDDDYIPPSPVSAVSPGNVLFSQTLSSISPENINHDPVLKRISSCLPSVDTQAQPKIASFQASFSDQKFHDRIKSNSAIRESSKSPGEEFSDSVSVNENLKSSFDNDKKFDIKASLFYDSDESDSESEADIFDGDEDNETESEADIFDGDEDDETEGQAGILADDCDERTVQGGDNDFEKPNFVKNVNKRLEISSDSEKKRIDKALLNISEAKQVEYGSIGNLSSAENMFMSKHGCVKLDNIKVIDQLPKPNLQPKDDCQISEADLQPEEYLDYDSDDDNDIDYQPDSQDFNVKSESDSEDKSCSDIEENSLERNDLDLLPLIRRPRQIRYRQLKEEEKKIYVQKRKETELEKLRNEIEIKTEIIYRTNQNENEVMPDELYARQLQDELDREAKQGDKRSLIDDAYIARKLHETLNEESAPNDNGAGKDNALRLQGINSSSGTLKTVDNERTESTDLAAVHSSPICHSSGNFPTLSSDISERYAENSHNPEALVRELQRRELKKIEKWKKMLMEDEKLAKRLQEMQENKEDEDNVEASAGGESQRKCSQSQQVETSFKKMVVQHKTCKEKAMAQLQQYRNLQMQRFQQVQNRSHSTFIPTKRENTTFDQENDVIIVEETQGNLATPEYAGINNADTRPDDTFPVNRIHVGENRQPLANGSQFLTHTVSLMNQPFNSGYMTQNSQSQSSSLNHMSHIYESQLVDGDHVIQSNQSQSVVIKHSKVTCGNCGEKGHNRTFQKCPKYHTTEESARREAKVEKSRQQKEEKRKQEVETIHMLSEHQKMLEDMTSQIQREMGTIHNRLQQRTSELEAQVSLRVKKIENLDKKKKK